MLKATVTTINTAARGIEIGSFAAIAVVGALLVWSKAGEFVACLSGTPGSDEAIVLRTHAASGRKNDLQKFAAVVLAAGIRPCSGAIILLVFTLSQGLFAAGVLGTVAMAIGTFITTGMLASLAVFARASAQKFAKLHGPMGARLLALFELLAAAFVLTLGIVLLTGAWSIAWPA